MNNQPLGDRLRRSWQAIATQTLRRLAGPAAKPPAQAAWLACAARILDNDDLQVVMQSVCTALREVTAGDCAAVVLREEVGGVPGWRFAATAGWRSDVVGEPVDLPSDIGGGVRPDRAMGAGADRAGSAATGLDNEGLIDGVWAAIESDGEPLGWVAVHARSVGQLNPTSGAAATAFATVLACALRREHRLRELRLQAQRAAALAHALPVGWLCLDARDTTVLDCSPALALMTGRTRADSIGQPAAELFATADGTPIADALCRPLHHGVELGLRLRLHRPDGQWLDCRADGCAFDGTGQAAGDPPRLLWVLHPGRTALSTGRAAGMNDGAAEGFEWALESDRQRRETSLRLLQSLREGLQGLQRYFDEPVGSPGNPRLPASKLTALALASLTQTQQAAEQAAIVLAAPAQGIDDLLAALEQVAHGVAARFGIGCRLDYAGPVVRLDARTRIGLFRACRDLLTLMVEIAHPATIVLRLDATEQGRLRVQWLATAEPGQRQRSAAAHALPPSRGLGLFGIKTVLASIGAQLTQAPDPTGEVFAAVQLPITPYRPATPRPAAPMPAAPAEASPRGS